ncbi:hypothetical protein [Luedemannella helvata]
MDPLPWWARSLAALIGLAAGSFGTFAIFRSDNQAGTAALLVLAAAFMLMGLQGTPLLRFGSGDASVQLAAIRRRAVQVAETAAQKESPEVAAAVADAVESITPGVLHPAIRYEKQLIAAIAQIDPTLEVVMPPHDKGIDLVVRDRHNRAAVIEVRYLTRQRLERHAIVAAEERLRGTPFEGRLIFVTSAPPDSQAERYLSERQGDDPITQLVVWNGPDDNGRLARALAQQLRF